MRSNQTNAPKRLVFTLRDCCNGELPLDVLFAKALKVITRIGTRPGEAKDTGPLASTPLCSANWLAKWAIRAVCEAILAEGLMPLPLAVDMRWKDGSRNFPSVLLPVLFIEYARQQKVSPRFLAEMILAKFMENAPEKLTLKTSYPLDPSEVLAGEEWKLPEDDDPAPGDRKGGR